MAAASGVPAHRPQRNSRAATGEHGAGESPTSVGPPYAASLNVYLYGSVDQSGNKSIG